MQNVINYPLGIQTFAEIRNGGYLYVDKTECIHKIVQNKYIFLSRPRRFGKSLLTSTLKAYFEGRKELFRGLAIDKLETEWAAYPVLHFDMSGAKHMDVERLERYLDKRLEPYEMHYGITTPAIDANERLNALIETAHARTGQRVVVLIDEYDAPLLDVLHEEEQLPRLRQVMRNFYSPIKKCDPYLRFVFLTGITKFSQLSIFSELNNIKNISMLKEYAGICGFTHQEMLRQMGRGIEDIAREQGWTVERTIDELKATYDGYHFCWPSEDIYCPHSLLNAMADRTIRSYWFGTATPSHLVDMFKKFDVSPAELGSVTYAMEEDFDAPTETLTEITPLLYQSGYITIKDYDPDTKVYALDIPNREIRMGLFRSLLPHYAGRQTRNANTTAARMQHALLRDDIDTMLRLLQDLLATIPGVPFVNRVEHYEAHWQQMLFVIFSLLGASVDVEVRTPRGRVDMVARTPGKLYLFELKLNKDALAAMSQIDLKQYSRRFALCGLPIVRVGINFSPEERNITSWQVEGAAEGKGF